MTLLNRKCDPYGSMGAIPEAKEGFSGEALLEGIAHGCGYRKHHLLGGGSALTLMGDLVPLQGMLLDVLNGQLPPPSSKESEDGL